IVYGERPLTERSKANKDLLQAASLATYFLETEQAEVFNNAWRNAVGRGKGWQLRAEQGKQALFRVAPELANERLWRL
ncbi:MAG: hypothetical protein RLZZ300_1501, partial [Pseudomonadota bacterium]